ncbi:rhomboid family intramembrane serine protease [Salipaludibacillus sp. LMS25]|jgi:rhomboid protease GluP|uniref:rhomboid family intramembrane serine protease n=1 Tax=Salipaludibacillus sp. LMS25 TaxID=2924031 RepID=UPI0020D16F34|nr:rhomboid family intramembrane serine protease [Salipaludibacillus sp. LMS25]UTR14435.1 rhomboid family intramembrane serine protease [Salipaludibacillus sp. LMS25]
MNVFTQSIRFWETLHHLTNKEGMRLVHLNEQEEVAWIEDDRREPYHLIRLSRKNYDWSNELKGDIHKAFDQANKVRKRLGLRQANISNIILSYNVPVDDFEQLTSQPLPLTSGGKKQFRTILIPLEELKHKIFPLATEWQLQDMPPYMDEAYIESSEQEDHIISTLKTAVKKSIKQREEKEKNLLLYGKARLTFLLLGTIILFYAWIEMNGSSMNTLDLVRFGAKFDPFILAGEWWRFISAMFIHIGIVHLMMNSLALFYLGSAVEKIFGTKRFFVIYFLAGLLGSIASFVFNDNVSAGASGAIFGCFGALLYFGLIHKRLFFRTMGMNVIVILAINLSFGFIVPMVDNGAHIGGLIGGFAASAIVGLPGQTERTIKLPAFLVTALSMVILLWVGFSQSGYSEQTALVYYQMAVEAIEEEAFDEAHGYLTEFLKGEDYITQERLAVDGRFLLSYVQIRQGDLVEAEANLIYVVNEVPDFHEAHYYLAHIYFDQGEYNRAFESAREALEAAPENDDYQQLYSEMEKYKGD